MTTETQALDQILEELFDRIEDLENKSFSPINATNLKVSQMPSGSPVETTDVIPFIRNVSGTWTNYRGPISDIINLVSGNFDPFDAKVTANGQIEADINTNHKWCVNIDGNITLQSNLVLTKSTVIYLSQAAQLNQSHFTIDLASHDLMIYTQTDGEWSHALNSAGSPIICTTGSGRLLVVNVTAGNAGSQANTPFIPSSNVKAKFLNCTITDNGQNNSGLVLSDNESICEDCTFIVADPSSQNILVLNNGAKSKDIVVNNFGTGSSNTLLQINASCVLDGLSALGNPISVISKGTVSNTKGTIAINMIGDVGSEIIACNTALNNYTIIGSGVINTACKFTGNIVINSGCTGTSWSSCYGGGTYTDNGSGTIGAANTGSIPNTDVGSSAILVETGSEKKISAMTDGTSFNPGDKIVIARSGQNYSLTQEEVLAAIPAAESAILVESGSSEKISGMTSATTAETTDLIPISRVISGSPVNRNISVQDILNLAPSTSISLVAASAVTMTTNPQTFTVSGVLTTDIITATPLNLDGATTTPVSLFANIISSGNVEFTAYALTPALSSERLDLSDSTILLNFMVAREA